MRQAPFLSVGVPTFDQGETIAATIESLLVQTEAPLEIVVCDNHSTDRTAEVLAGFGDRIRVVRPPRHLPMMANWNRVVAELRGEWIALISSDDLAFPCFVEALSRGARARSDAVLVRGNVELIDGEGRRLGDRKRRPLRVSTPPRNLRERLAGPRVNFGAAAFRKDAWRRAGGFAASVHLMGDWAFWLELCPLGSFVTVPETILRYRKGYRSPATENARIPFWAEDLRTIYRDRLPRLAREVGSVSPRQVRRAMRTRCQNFLARQSRWVPPAERRAIAEALAGWARDCEVVPTLERFRAGGPVPKTRWRGLRRLAASLGLS